MTKRVYRQMKTSGCWERCKSQEFPQVKRYIDTRKRESNSSNKYTIFSPPLSSRSFTRLYTASADPSSMAPGCDCITKYIAKSRKGPSFCLGPRHKFGLVFIYLSIHVFGYLCISFCIDVAHSKGDPSNLPSASSSVSARKKSHHIWVLRPTASKCSLCLSISSFDI